MELLANKDINLDKIKLKITDIKFVQNDREGDGTLKIYWSSIEGSGNLDIVKMPAGKLLAFSEGMDNGDKKFIKKIISLLVSKLIVMQ